MGQPPLLLSGFLLMIRADEWHDLHHIPPPFHSFTQLLDPATHLAIYLWTQTPAELNVSMYLGSRGSWVPPSDTAVVSIRIAIRILLSKQAAYNYLCQCMEQNNKI